MLRAPSIASWPLEQYVPHLKEHLEAMMVLMPEQAYVKPFQYESSSEISSIPPARGMAKCIHSFNCCLFNSISTACKCVFRGAFQGSSSGVVQRILPGSHSARTTGNNLQPYLLWLDGEPAIVKGPFTSISSIAEPWAALELREIDGGVSDVNRGGTGINGMCHSRAGTPVAK